MDDNRHQRWMPGDRAYPVPTPGRRIQDLIGDASRSTLPADHWQALKAASDILIDEFSEDVGLSHHLEAWRLHSNGLFLSVAGLPIDWRDESSWWPADESWKPW